MKPQPTTSAAPQASTLYSPSSVFTCPYCGPDENGAEIHRLTNHTQPPLTLAQAQAAVKSGIVNRQS